MILKVYLSDRDYQRQNNVINNQLLIRKSFRCTAITCRSYWIWVWCSKNWSSLKASRRFSFLCRWSLFCRWCCSRLYKFFSGFIFWCTRECFTNNSIFITVKTIDIKRFYFCSIDPCVVRSNLSGTLFILCLSSSLGRKIGTIQIVLTVFWNRA